MVWPKTVHAVSKSRMCLSDRTDLRRSKIAKTLLKKSKVNEFDLSDMKTYKATVIRIVD